MKNRFRVLNAPLNGLTFFQRTILRTLLFLFAPLIKVENEETIPPANQPVIFAFNHNSSFETLLITIYLIYKREGEKVNFVVDWMYGYIPIIGWFVRQIDPIFVYNKRARFGFLNRIKHQDEQKNVYQECFRRLKQNHSIGIFPEGTRNRNPNELKKGQRGIGKIALKTGASVLPIGIDFPKRIKHGKIPKFGSLILRVGTKLNFTQEIAMVQNIIQSNKLSPIVKNELLNFFDAKVTHQIMQYLAKLSWKKYPFSLPVLSPRSDLYLKKFINTGELICQE